MASITAFRFAALLLSTFGGKGFRLMIFKSIKKAMAWTTVMLILLVVSILGSYLAFRSPRVQTYITQQLASYVADELNTEVSVQGVNVGFFNRVILEGVHINDLQGDTLLYLRDLHLGVRYISLDKRQLHFGRVRIDDLKFHLQYHPGEEGMNLQFILDLLKQDEKQETAGAWDIRGRELELRNASFLLRDNRIDHGGVGIDYKGLDVRHINMLVDDIRIDKDTIFGNMQKLSCIETHGFRLRNFRGKAKVSPAELLVRDLHIETPHSEVDLDLHYTYSDWTDYRSFVDSVRMDYHFRDTRVNLKDVAFFAKGLHGLQQELRITGHVYGPVSGLNGRDLDIHYGRGTHIEGNIDMDGLPNINETFLFLDLDRMVTDYTDLSSIPLPPFTEGKTLNLPPNLRNLGKLDFSGSFTGFINDFVARGQLITSIGRMNTDLALKRSDETGLVAYKGNLRSQDFDLGKFLETEKIGKVTLKTNVNGSGLSKESINAKLVGSVQSAELVGYEYRNIEVNGEFANSRFDGEMALADTNLNLNFKGAVDLSQKMPEFQFRSKVKHANLYELNILRKRENATVSGDLTVDFIGDDIDNIIGRIELTDGRYQQKGDPEFHVPQLTLEVSEDETFKKLQLRSAVADADFEGMFTFRNIPKAVNNLIYKHLPSYASEFEKLEENEGLEFDFGVDLKDTRIVSYFLAPDLEVSDSSSVMGSFSSSRNEVFLRAKMPNVSYQDINFKKVEIEAENPGSDFLLGVFSEQLNLTDSVYMQDLSVRSFTFNDSLGLEVRWDNRSEVVNRAFVQGVASFPRDQRIRFHLAQSSITVADLEWTVDEDNLLTVDSSAFIFENFRFKNAVQSIGLNGVVSKDPKTKLNVTLQDFDLANFNLFTARSGLMLGGDVSGNAELSGLFETLFFTNQVDVDSLVVNEVYIGSGEINNTWIPETRSVQVFGLLRRKDLTTMNVLGEFLPGDDRKQNFNLRAVLNGLPVDVFSPYISTVMSDVNGFLKADLSLRGTMNDPELTGTVMLDRTDLLFTYLNTRYRVSDTVQVKKDGFYFEDLRVLDERDRKGTINGWVKHTGFKDFRFDADIRVDNFMALNTNSAMNSLYYGKAFATGLARFHGHPKDMNLEVSMRTERGTRFNIPLFGAESVDESDFITFVKPEGAEEKLSVDDEFQVDFQNLSLELDVEVTSDAEVQLIFDPAVGDIIKGKGDGDIRMTLDRTGNFKMFGDYYINKGEYLFTLQNIVNKKFLIQQGGTINWSGSPYDAIVDITANYSVRTSLYDLMYPDTSDIYRRRIQVDCILNMTGDLMSPQINFDVALPNSDEQIETEMRNRIGVGNEQEMNRQVFGLLVLNRFFPTESQNQALQQTGEFFSSSSAEMISNQLSNWLSKISNDFDIGLNYRPGDNITSDEVEVALSTQVFNNRILIDGNVGMANMQSNSSNIVGDVNIEYKITADGRFRVRAFNKSNDINMLTRNAPFTQGVGISYQKEFNRVGDLFRRRKKDKKKKEAPPQP